MKHHIATIVLVTWIAMASAAAGNQPNIVVLLVDDLGWTDLGCFGSDFYQTPHIDKLAGDGMKFTRAYAATNCCSPTRGALMTGMYPAKTHLTDWIPGWGQQYSRFKMRPPDWTQELELKYTTVAEALHDAGYATFHLGKWHLGNESHFPEHQGFDVNIGGTDRGGPKSYHFPYGGEAMKWNSVLPEEKREGRYLTDRLADEAVALIAEAQKDKPFFMYFSFYGVHTPIEGRPDLVEKYDNLPPGKLHHNPNYAAMIESVDTAVGRVREELEKTGVANNTVIIFASDNGAVVRDISSNAPLRGQKGQHWEGGERVPSIIFWPGVTTPGSSSDEMTITMDYYPTILEIAGVAGDSVHNEKVDGLSLTGLLKDPETHLDRDVLFWHYPHYNPLIGVPYGAVRTGDYKLIEYYEDEHIELYNLAEDLGEQHDLAEAKPEIATRMQTQLHEFRDRVGAQMPVPNPKFDPKNKIAEEYYEKHAKEVADGL